MPDHLPLPDSSVRLPRKKCCLGKNSVLPDAPADDRIAAYEHHMKFGPSRDYWTEFVFEAYVNHRSDVIFLKGLPDVPKSRPHSRVNSR